MVHYQQDHAPRRPPFPRSAEDCLCVYGEQLTKPLNASCYAVEQKKTHHRARTGARINVPGLGANESPTMSNNSSAIAWGLGELPMSWGPSIGPCCIRKFYILHI